MKSIIFILLLFVNVLRADGTAAAETLAKAARAGDLKTLENLLSSGVSPDLPDQYGRAPISYAASFNQTKTVELLLAYHADPNPRDHRSKYAHQMPATPLQSAAELGNRRIASLLLAAGARVDDKGPAGRTALHCANDQLDVIKLLIDKGADVNARDEEGASPLDEAVWYGSFDTVALLLANGARLNESESKTGATPINEAAYKGHTRLVEYLLQFKPDIETPDKHGYRPLDNAIRMGNEEAALLLLEAEAPAKQTPAFFGKALDAAIRKDESALVESLLRHGANSNGTLPSGGTLLDAAAFGGSAKVVGVLLKNGADPNLTGRNGNSPLEDASLKGFDAIAGMLLDHGALVNRIGDTSETTALYSAASFGKDAVVELLLKRGANPNLCGAGHKTPLSAAFENSYTSVAQLLQQHGGKTACELSASPRP
jgi:ankyrin repeat protein